MNRHAGSEYHIIEFWAANLSPFSSLFYLVLSLLASRFARGVILIENNFKHEKFFDACISKWLPNFRTYLLLKVRWTSFCLYWCKNLEVTNDNWECGNRWSLQINPDAFEQTINNHNTIQRKLITLVSPAQQTITQRLLGETTHFKRGRLLLLSGERFHFCDKTASPKSGWRKTTWFTAMVNTQLTGCQTDLRGL